MVLIHVATATESEDLRGKVKFLIGGNGGVPTQAREPQGRTRCDSGADGIVRMGEGLRLVWHDVICSGKSILVALVCLYNRTGAAPVG